MSNPFKPNASCDIYHKPHVIGVDPPDVVLVYFTLIAAWEQGQAHGQRQTPNLMFTHIAHFEPTVDIRDGYTGAMGYAIQDQLLVPSTTDPVDANPACTYRVTFIERVNLGQRADHFIAYLDRYTPAWPTSSI